MKTNADAYALIADLASQSKEMGDTFTSFEDCDADIDRWIESDDDGERIALAWNALSRSDILRAYGVVEAD